MKLSLLIAVLVVGAAAVPAQTPPPRDPGATVRETLVPGDAVREMNERLSQVARSASGLAGDQQDYQIGPEDLVDIGVFEVPELSRTVRVSAGGEISLPLLGSVKAAGLTPLQLERVLRELLRRTYLKDPQVTVFLREFKSDPVSVMGAVKMPGLYHIQTRKTLVEVLAMAQGLSDGPMRHPGRTVVITHKPRRAAAAPQAEASSGGAEAPASLETETKAEIIEVPLKELLQSGDPKHNVPVFPGDVVKVVPAGTVYVAGSVNHPGGFPLTDFDNISAVQALAMAGGTTKAASSRNAIIIRRDAAGSRLEEKINLGRILKGKDTDTMMGSNDILFIPGSVGKESALRAVEMAIQTATGMLIWRR